MPAKRAFDRVLFVTIILLCVSGLVMIYSASAVVAAEQHGSPYHFLIRQGAAMLIGLAGMVLMMRANYRALGRAPLVYGLLGIAALLLVGALISPAVNGTHRWLRLGPISLQPSELAKPALILFLAWRLQRDHAHAHAHAQAQAHAHAAAAAEPIDLHRTLIPCLILSGLIILLVVMQPDLGTAVLLSILSGAMFLAAGVRLRWLAAAAAAGAILLLVVIPMKGYQIDRFTSFLDPGADPLGSGYHVRQSVIAVGAGGATGTGLSQGRQKLFFLPYPYTDFVYSVIGEELGLVGALLMLGAFVVLLWRGLRVASRAPDMFGSYLAVGVTIFLVSQALINMSVALGMLPAKGLPLPFVSYGGSALVAGLLASGILLNVSQYSS